MARPEALGEVVEGRGGWFGTEVGGVQRDLVTCKLQVLEDRAAKAGLVSFEFVHNRKGFVE